MRKCIALLVAIIATLAVAVPAMAAAPNPPNEHPQHPCLHNPTDLCDDDDDVTVRPATPQECPNGGIVILADDAFVVCNGVNGDDGTVGATGATGITGTTGAAGATGAAGVAGAVGVAAPVSGAVPKVCQSHRNITITLPPRFKGKTVLVKYDGVRKLVKVGSKRHVKVKLAGLRPGIYAVVITSKNVKREVRLYSTCRTGKLGGVNVIEPGENSPDKP